MELDERPGRHAPIADLSLAHLAAQNPTPSAAIGEPHVVAVEVPMKHFKDGNAEREFVIAPDGAHSWLDESASNWFIVGRENDRVTDLHDEEFASDLTFVAI
jgi:hypothetical protein